MTPEVTSVGANSLIERLAGRFRERTVTLPADPNPASVCPWRLLPWSNVCSLNQCDEFPSFFSSQYDANPFASVSTGKITDELFLFWTNRGVLAAVDGFFNIDLRAMEALSLLLTCEPGEARPLLVCCPLVVWPRCSNLDTFHCLRLCLHWVLNHPSEFLIVHTIFSSFWLHAPLSEWRMEALHREQKRWAAALNPTFFRGRNTRNDVSTSSQLNLNSSVGFYELLTNKFHLLRQSPDSKTFWY